MTLNPGDIVEKDGKQFEYIGNGHFREVSALTKRFIDGDGEFVLHRNSGINLKIEEFK